MSNSKIVVKGARANNLKDISVEIPRDKLVVFTGLSGSGKSSLAFDTIYAEGQRRYIESLSSYARMFLGQMEKPDVDSIDGLSPAISIDQKTTSKNPRSTVGTVTEIYDYLRLLYARVGTPHCPKCGKPITSMSIDQMTDKVMSLPEGQKIQLLAPLARGKKGEYVQTFEKLKKDGFARVKVDGEVRSLDEEIKLKKTIKHDIFAVVDRLVIKEGISRRLSESLETALKLAGGICHVDLMNGEEIVLSSNLACPDCGISIAEITPRMFSFNNPFGACPNCSGLGFLHEFDVDLIIPDKTKSLEEGAITLSGFGNISNETGWNRYIFENLAKEYKFKLSTPFNKLSKEVQDVILYGSGDKRFYYEYEGGSFTSRYEGVINTARRRYESTDKESVKEMYQQFMKYHVCRACGGKKLKPESLAVTVNDINIYDLTDLSVVKLVDFFEKLKFKGSEQQIAAPIVKEIKARLNFLKNVGLGYLTLSRASGTLSGGESQRIRLATQIGSGLMGVLYILDEPSIGLHQRDNDKLLDALKKLRDLGNTLIVVEHDEETMKEADYIVDIGPGAGSTGGEVVFCGTPEEIMKCDKSLTGKYLSGKLSIPVPEKRKKGNGFSLSVKGAAEHNLKNVNADIPLGTLTCVTGVSGSGKSSLVNEIIYKASAKELNKTKTEPGKFREILGLENLDKVINIDQSPIGRTPRSNPATYTGTFDLIRDIFAQTRESRARGYKNGRFSFNVKGGRCENCQGDGIKKIEMHFLPDIYVPCEVCKGKRYNRETLEVKYKGKSIAEVLDMTIEEAVDFFADIPKIRRKIETLDKVGLGYIKLGQPSTTLSGGEAQRVKLATELSKKSTGKTLYILDEPTTGLHTDDVRKLIEILQKLVEGGNTVLVIEHNLDVIKCADHIIDLGPEGGDEGGKIIAKGTPEQLAQNDKSYTGIYLKRILEEKK